MMICLVSTYHLLGYGCFWWECAPERNFTIYDIVFPMEFFPPGSPEPVMVRSKGIVGAKEEAFGGVSGIARYEFVRFTTFRKAKTWYQTRLEHNIFTSTLEDPEEYVRIFSYQSKYADEYFIDCGYVFDDLQCLYKARYGEYFVYFNGSVGDEKLTKDAYLEILDHIDERFSFEK